jgi:hypothetical protein
MVLKPENWKLNRKHRARLGVASADCRPPISTKLSNYFLIHFFRKYDYGKRAPTAQKKIYWPIFGIIARWSSLSGKARKREGEELKRIRQNYVAILNVKTEISADHHRNPMKAGSVEQAIFCHPMFLVECEYWIKRRMLSYSRHPSSPTLCLTSADLNDNHHFNEIYVPLAPVAGKPRIYLFRCNPSCHP